MKINRENYEAFFMDYIEGTLDESVMNDFIDFLIQNPDLKAELNEFKRITIQPENLVFNHKEYLFRNRYDLENEFNNAAIAFIEGDIQENIKSDFENYLNAHPEKVRDFRLFQKTKLLPDESMLFEKKSRLYKKNAGKPVFMWAVRFAAVFILTLSTFKIFEYYTNSPGTVNPVAENENPVMQLQLNHPAKIAELKINSKSDALKVTHLKKKNTPVSEKAELMNTELIQTIDYQRDSLLLLSAIDKAGINLIIPAENLNLAAIIPKKINSTADSDQERLFADVIREKTGIKNLSFNQIARSGLNLVSSLSKEKFTYKTDTAGNITKLSLDSRILAFSIPTNNRE